MKLITEVTESLQYLAEEKDGKKTLFIEGPFLQAEVVKRVKCALTVESLSLLPL